MKPPARTLLAGIAGVLATVVVPVAPAAAAPYGCDASALRGTVIGSATVEPITANRGAVACTTAIAGGAEALKVSTLLSAGAASAATSLTGPADRQADQAALAAGGIADLKVGSLPDLGIALDLTAVNAAIDAIPPIGLTITPAINGTPATITVDPITVPAITVPGTTTTTPATTIPGVSIPLPGVSLPDLGLPVAGTRSTHTTLSADIRPALKALAGQLGALPRIDLVRLQSAMAYAGARCQDGRSVPSGVAQTAGLTVLGQAVDTNKAVNAPLRILDTKSIVPAAILDDPALLQLVAGPIAMDATVLKTVLTPVLGAIPAISIPEALATLKVTPAHQIVAGSRLVQRALRVELSGLGRSLVDLTIGEAAVTAGGIDCSAGEGAVLGASEQALSCTKRKLVLIDVLQGPTKAQFYGAADKKYIGKTVSIYFRADGKRVARAKVRKDGSFRASAKLPKRSLRSTNKARYQARIGRERSLSLKLQRRMTVRSIRSSGGKVVIVGRVKGPLTRPKRTSVTVRRRLSCKKYETVKKVKVSKNGTYRVVLDAPPGQTAAVYRMQTKVQKTKRNKKRFPTYTLPRAVNLLD